MVSRGQHLSSWYCLLIFSYQRSIFTILKTCLGLFSEQYFLFLLYSIADFVADLNFADSFIFFINHKEYFVNNMKCYKKRWTMKKSNMWKLTILYTIWILFRGVCSCHGHYSWVMGCDLLWIELNTIAYIFSV